MNNLGSFSPCGRKAILFYVEKSFVLYYNMDKKGGGVLELLEAIFGMFGDSIVSSYFNLIERSAFLNRGDIEERKKRLKRIISIVAGVIFLVGFVSFMLCFLVKGMLRNICLLIFLICVFIVVIYVLVGFILRWLCNRKNKK